MNCIRTCTKTRIAAHLILSILKLEAHNRVGLTLKGEIYKKFFLQKEKKKASLQDFLYQRFNCIRLDTQGQSDDSFFYQGVIHFFILIKTNERIQLFNIYNQLKRISI